MECFDYGNLITATYYTQRSTAYHLQEHPNMQLFRHQGSQHGPRCFLTPKGCAETGLLINNRQYKELWPEAPNFYVPFLTDLQGGPKSIKATAICRSCFLPP